MSELTEKTDAAWGSLPPAELEAFLRNLCDEMEAAHGRVSSEYVTAANELGTYLRVTASYKDGEAAFKNALASMEQLVGKNDSYATCLDNLAELYRLAGDLESCERCLAEADGIFSDKQSLEYAACLNYQGHLAESKKDPEAAKQCYLRSLAIVEPARPGSIDLATGYQNVANAYQAAGELKEAEEYLAKAMGLYSGGALSVNSHYVSLLNQMASLQLQQAKDAEAERSFDAAIEALGQTPVSPLDAIVVYTNAASLYRAYGRADKFADAVAAIKRLAAIDTIAQNPLVQRINETVARWEA